jgi:hypothetical protein
MKIMTSLKKLCWLASISLAACLVHNAAAQSGWIDTDLNGFWADTNNWSGGAPATTAGWSTVINPAAGPTCTITNGEVESPASLSDDASTYGSVYGPEFGASLDIYGTLNFNWVIAPVQNDPTPANRSVINLYSGSSLNGVNLGLGTEWWYWAAPYVTLNMYGNAQANVANLWLGGHVNLYDTSVLNATNSIQDQGSLNAVTDGSRSLNISGGRLVLPTGSTSQITNFIGRGVLLAYGQLLNLNDAVTNVETGADGTTNITTVDALIIADNGTNTVVSGSPITGALQGIAFQPLLVPVSSPGSFQQTTLLGTYPGVSKGVVLHSADPALTNLDYTSSDPNVFTVTASGLVTATGPGTATLKAQLGAFSSSVSVAVAPFSTIAKSLIHRYSFAETSGTNTADSVGGTNWAGTLIGGATFAGGQVVLDGISGYVQLPAGIVSNLNAVTFETWVTFNGNPINTWAVLYAFGDSDTNSDANAGSGENYITFQPHTGGTTAQQTFGQGLPGNAAETDAVGSQVLDGLTNVHIVAIYNPAAGSFSYYTNGVLAASAGIYNTLTAPATYKGPLDQQSVLAYTLGTDPLNYLGHSLYAADPYLNASIDEFRIYDAPMQPAQIRADLLLGPNELIGTNTSVRLTAIASSGNLVVTWPTSSALVNLVSSPALGAGAVWTAVSNGTLVIVGGNYQETVTATGSAQFFKLE